MVDCIRVVYLGLHTAYWPAYLVGFTFARVYPTSLTNATHESVLHSHTEHHT